ncbi:hypothetical protein KCU62_g2105, partial [Aureobasidium sp. EXF-3399]
MVLHRYMELHLQLLMHTNNEGRTHQLRHTHQQQDTRDCPEDPCNKAKGHPRSIMDPTTLHLHRSNREGTEDQQQHLEVHEHHQGTDNSMVDSLYFQPATTLGLEPMDKQQQTTRDQHLHNINNMMEGEGGIRALGTESSSIIMGRDD